MKKLSSTIFALGFYTTLFLGGVVGGCSGDKGGSTQGSRTVPRPVTSSDAGPANAIEDDCDPGEQCTGAASCQGVCGLHELGDRACMCTSNTQRSQARQDERCIVEVHLVDGTFAGVPLPPVLSLFHRNGWNVQPPEPRNWLPPLLLIMLSTRP